jgi:hypothetical protein
MRTQQFSLHGEIPARLELRWQGATANVYFDSKHVTSLHGSNGLRTGWSTLLEDGSTIEVRAIRRVLLPELSILRNCQHVASSPFHPDLVLVTSSNVLLAVSAFMLIAGTLGLWGRHWMTAVFGAVYLIGALVLRARRKLGAIIIAVPLFLEFAFLVWSAITAGVSGRWAVDLFLNLVFARFVVRSYQAAHDSRSLRESTAPAG